MTIMDENFMQYVVQKKLVDGEQSSIVMVQAAWPQLFPSLAVSARCMCSAEAGQEESARSLQALPPDRPAQPLLTPSK